jgi:16S rRNA processing protein RimM
MNFDNQKNNTNLIEIAKIGAPHGLNGAFFLVCNDRRKSISEYSALSIANKTYKVLRTYLVSEKLAVVLEGVQNRSQAESLRNQKVSVFKNEISVAENEVLVEELLGVKVLTQLPDLTILNLGKVISVQNFGAQETLEIEVSDEFKITYPKQTESTFYFPYVENFIREFFPNKNELHVEYAPDFWS